jgi:drug/metabolite transporter (DMT)-like permease
MPRRPSPADLRPTLIGCGALALWATSLPFARHCAETIGPLTTAALQYAVSGAGGLALAAARGKLADRGFLKNREFAARTGLFALYYALLYAAIGLVARAQFPFVTLINYLWPTFTMPLSVYMLRQRCRPALLLAGMATVALGFGVEVLGGGALGAASALDARNLAAYAAAAGGALCWSFYTVLNRKWGARAGGLDGLPFVLLATAAVLCALRFAVGEHADFPHCILWPLLYLCVMPLAANACWDVGTRLGNIILLTLLADTMPWASLTATRLYLSIQIGPETWLSAAVIVAGALLARYSLLTGAQKPRDGVAGEPEP